MNKLGLKITGNHAGMAVYVNGKPLGAKNNKFQNAVAEVATEKDKVKIEVFRYADVGGIGWFVLQLLFFLVSIFGIFDARRREKCVLPCFAVEAELTGGNTVTLKPNPQRAGQRAFEIESDAPITELSNEYVTDDKAKKTLKALLAVKIVLTIAVVAGILLGIFL